MNTEIRLPAPPSGRLDELRRRLVDTASAQGLLDVTYCVHDTPAGLLLLAATESGLLRVVFACEDHDKVLQGLADTVTVVIGSLRGLNA